MWKDIKAIYKKWGLINSNGNYMGGIWKSSEAFRLGMARVAKDLAKDLGSGNTLIECCPRDPIGNLCGKNKYSGGYIPSDNAYGFNINHKYIGRIIICPTMMSKEAMDSRNGGCGCFIMHELMHRYGMTTPHGSQAAELRGEKIEKAMIEMQKYILRHLKDRNCKGHGIE